MVNLKTNEYLFSIRSLIIEGIQCRLHEEEIQNQRASARDMLDMVFEEEKAEVMDQSEKFELIYSRDDSENHMKLTDFTIMNLIGKGSISNVYLIKKNSDQQPYAMKCIQKEIVLE